MRAAALLLALACAAPQVQGMQKDDALAVLVEPSPQARDAIVRALAGALGSQVMLADDALTSDSKLIIERSHLEGRDLGQPEQFVLVKNGGSCVLIHQRTQKRYALPEASCEAR